MTLSELTTRELIDRAHSGDREAFDALARRHRSHLDSVIQRKLGKKLRTHLTVEDAAQETLFRAFKSLPQFEWRSCDGSTDPFFRWLCGIAGRVILEGAKRQRRATPIALDFEVADDGVVSPARELARQERRACFDTALDGLSVDQQEVLRLVRLEGLSVKEAARRTGRSPNAVSQLILRALRRLRERIDDTGSLGLGDPRPGEAGREAAGAEGVQREASEGFDPAEESSSTRGVEE